MKKFIAAATVVLFTAALVYSGVSSSHSVALKADKKPVMVASGSPDDPVPA